MAAQTYTCGDTKTYSTITLTIAAIIVYNGGDLSALGGGVQTVEVYAKAPSNIYAENVDAVTGFTNPGVADYIHISAMQSHGGKSQAAGGSGICLDASGGAIGFSIIAYTRLDGFEVKDATGGGIAEAYGIDTGIFCHVYNNIIHGISTTGVFRVAGIHARDGSRVYNDIVYYIRNASNTNCQGIWMHRVAARAFCYNCSVYDVVSTTIARGICLHSTRVNTFINCYGADASGFDFAANLDVPTVTYCTSSDVTGTGWGGAGNQINKAAVNQFVNLGSGTEDFHVKDIAADIYHSGSTPFTPNDAVGVLWATPNGSRGALEFVPEAAGVTGVFRPGIFDSPIYGGVL